MQKKKFITLFTVSIVAVLLSVTTLILYFFPFINRLTANEIYKQCLQNVVEIKAETANVGQSFGTREVISRDGRIITNTHVVTYSICFSFEGEYRTAQLEKYDTNLD